MRRFGFSKSICFSIVLFNAITSCTNYQEKAIPDDLYVSIKKMSFAEAGEANSFIISSGTRWDLTNLPPWISLDAINKLSGSPYEWTVVLSATANDGYNREGAITVIADSGMEMISVEQRGLKGVKTELTLNGHSYVEMGNGLKWATMNLGAGKQEDFGDYYAWGETKPKDFYSWITYFDNPSCDGTTFVKYDTDKKTHLDLSDDAARQNWGSTWRIPSDEEWTWLMKHCTSTWTDDYNGTGVSGLIVTSAISGFEGNHIFLPAAGYKVGDSISSSSTQGSYWSSSIRGEKDYSNYARGILFFSDNNYRGFYYRMYGLSIRPVSE